jgi:hypothetical protein
MKFTFAILLATIAVSQSLFAAVGADKPKYGPGVTLLSTDHKYIATHSAPDYWRLSPFYVGQQTDSACSLAVISTIVNAARPSLKLLANEELVTQSSLLKKLADAGYEKQVATGGEGITLELLKDVLERSLKIYAIQDFTLTLVKTPEPSAAAKEGLHRALIKNEQSGSDFIIAYFSQGVLTGDELVGHFAAVGAYDLQKRRALILDPDRQWYEPYWVSESMLLKSMVETDKVAPQGRGYLLVKLKD